MTKNAQAKFISSTPAEEISAVNNQVESKMDDQGQVMFNLLVKGFTFENSLMQEHFNNSEYMFSDKFPKASFKGNIVRWQTVDLKKDGSHPAMVDGKLTIKGITKPLQATGLIEVEKGKVKTRSKFKISLKDFGFTGKEIGKVISNTVEINVIASYD